MNWDAISAIGEIVGAAAVVVTLAYLAIQIRNSTKIARSSTRQAIASMAFVMDFKREDVDDADWVRLLARNYIGMRHYENIHYQYLCGMIEPDEWLGFRRNLKSVLQWRSMEVYWQNENQYYSDAFREEIGEIQTEIARDADGNGHSYVFDSPVGRNS